LISRKKLAAMPPLRALNSIRYLIHSIGQALRGTEARLLHAAQQDYDATHDRWGYESDWGREHLAKTAAFIETARRRAPLHTAVEVGCGEGFVTSLLAQHVRSALALDVSEVALERARARCAATKHVAFRRWNLLKDAPTGSYDLVLAMGVLEVFQRPSQLLVARRTILSMVGRGRHLLVTTTLQHPAIERSTWSGYLVRGGDGMHRFLLRTGALNVVCSEDTHTHRFTLYQKRS
jgi:2-polyprenyl-3-methyl-5-hydroxy-6-metoxy-1,4-benzoquinol methylase